MNANFARCLFFSFCLLFFITELAGAQDYVSPTKPAETGKSPGVKIQLLDSTAGQKTYVLIFSPGDEVVSGLTEFAQNHQVSSAHYSAIGDAVSAKVGWYDSARKMFKVISLSKPCEITSLIGDIAIFNGKPVAHSHINLATEDGITHGGHLLELFIGPTLELFVTVYTIPLNKKLDPRSGAGVIDPSMAR